jgi:hypothetical protein
VTGGTGADRSGREADLGAAAAGVCLKDLYTSGELRPDPTAKH